MTNQNQLPRPQSLQATSRLLASLGAVIALLALLGSTLNFQLLQTLLPGAAPTTPGPAICLALSSFALLLGAGASPFPLNPQSAVPSPPSLAPPSLPLRAAQACAGLVILIAVLLLLQIAGLNLGLDPVFLSQSPATAQHSALDTPYPAPLNPLTPLAFLLDAIAINLLLSRSPRAYHPAQIISLATGFLAILALTDYALVPYASLVTGQSPPLTALGLLLLSASLLLVRPDRGLVAPIASPTPHSALRAPNPSILLRLSFAAVAVPVALILLVGAGFHLGLYSQRVSASVILALGVLVILALVWISARSLNRLEATRQHAEASVRKQHAIYRAILDDQTEPIARLLPDGTLTYANPAFAHRHGLRPEKLIGRSLLTLPYISDQESKELQARLACLTWEHPLGIVDTRSPLPNGEYRWYQWTMRALFDDQQRFVEFQLAGVDITERKLIEEQLGHQAFHDALTGLPNRVLFRDRLSHALARARRNGTSIAVLFLDLDNFKVINDSLGHKVGDQLLAAVSSRLQECVRAEDTIARLGGDEFTVLLEDITDFHTAVSIAERIGEKLQVAVALTGPDQLRTTTHLERHVFITSSIGIAMQSSAYETPEDLLRNADIAMYEAKSKGKSRFEIFERSMTSRFTEHLELETDLRRALDRGEFKVYYQPIVKLGNGRITEVEALIRWEHPERRLVAPADFIPAAEQSGLIVPIGQWVLEQACKQALEWQKQFPREPHEPPLGVSVNLSARQFQHPQLIDEIAHVVRDTGLDPRFLKLEITESVGIDDVNSASATLWKLKDLGLRLALDDFGTGYSALSYLKNFPFDTLKLDRAFVDGLGFDPEDTAIVHAAIAFAKALGLSVTAEGIENKEQILELQKLGCDHGQGYYFARPMTGAAIAVLLANPPWIRPGKSMDYHPAIRLAAGLAPAD